MGISGMGWFSRKVEKPAAAFCEEFYDQFVFTTGPGSSVDVQRTFAESTRRLIGEVDPLFAAIDLDKLADELLALRMEMIGTAWTHSSQPDAAFEESLFTQSYLSQKGRDDVWEGMGEYNHAVADAVTFKADRMRIALANKARADLFDKLVDVTEDKEKVAQAAARVANRVESKSSWKAGVTPILLSIRLMRRLGIEEDSEPIAQRLAAVAYGNYQGATEALNGIKLTLSPPAELAAVGSSAFSHDANF